MALSSHETTDTSLLALLLDLPVGENNMLIIDMNFVGPALQQNTFLTQQKLQGDGQETTIHGHRNF